MLPWRRTNLIEHYEQGLMHGVVARASGQCYVNAKVKTVQNCSHHDGCGSNSGVERSDRRRRPFPEVAAESGTACLWKLFRLWGWNASLEMQVLDPSLAFSFQAARLGWEPQNVM
jgi:hypothetical protein